MNKLSISKKSGIILALVVLIVFVIINVNYWVISHAEGEDVFKDVGEYVTNGDFEVASDDEGNYNYVDGVLTIYKGTLKIKNVDPSKPTKNRIVIKENAGDVNVALEGVNIMFQTSQISKNDAQDNWILDDLDTKSMCAFYISDNITNVNLYLSEGTNNVLSSGDFCSGIHKGMKKENENGSLTIKNYSHSSNNQFEGTLTATGGVFAAGIGGDASSDYFHNSSSNITIESGKVKANGGLGAAGMGGGCHLAFDLSDCNYAFDISVLGGELESTGNDGGAGIGSGSEGEAKNITIKNCKVTANSIRGHGAGIGSGIGQISDLTHACDIHIINAVVSANGGTGSAGIGAGWNAVAIGICIESSIVNAEGGFHAAGIGGGASQMGENYGCAFNIEIDNSVVTAIGNGGGCGIGEGAECDSSQKAKVNGASGISINGGSVKASSIAECGANNKSGHLVHLLKVYNPFDKLVYINDSENDYGFCNHSSSFSDDKYLYMYLPQMDTLKIKLGEDDHNVFEYKFENNKWNLVTDIFADNYNSSKHEDIDDFYKWDISKWEPISLKKENKRDNNFIGNKGCMNYHFDSLVEKSKKVENYMIGNLNLEYISNDNFLKIGYITKTNKYDEKKGFAFRIKCTYTTKDNKEKVIYLNNNMGMNYEGTEDYSVGYSKHKYENGWYRDEANQSKTDYCTFDLNKKISNQENKTMSQIILNKIYGSDNEKTISDALKDGRISFELVEMWATQF